MKILHNFPPLLTTIFSLAYFPPAMSLYKMGNLSICLISPQHSIMRRQTAQSKPAEESMTTVKTTRATSPSVPLLPWEPWEPTPPLWYPWNEVLQCPPAPEGRKSFTVWYDPQLLQTPRSQTSISGRSLSAQPGTKCP